ncbi:MAG: ABC transporter ATP-binding protein [Algoriphagus sp.]|uniref:ABC transporter ATP-binding protein n=1 Tax=Algoriphagus sp. TaxID=1872435 RepID=UPI002634708D|nr:ABC transporter ATP-binding protein [Algoriphagus sp.]MDG1277740.1 ABC transporter ATP-binding protein [Algoriphagus sp.]
MISIQNLSFFYPKKSALFQELDWECPAGSIVGFLGKNGAGKSTFLRLLSGLIFPKSGSVEVNGQYAKDRSPDFLQELFMVPDELALPLHLSVSAYSKMMSPFYPRFDQTQFQSILKDFEIEPNSKLGDFSFGQQKKVILAFALSTNCKLLLFDEPTNGLDIPSKTSFRKAVAANLSEEQTLIIATHLVKDVENLIDRVVILADGKVRLDQDLLELSDRLSFGMAASAPEHAIYMEKNKLGVQFIQARDSGENQTPVSLELLFNAVISGAISTSILSEKNLASHE